VSDRATNELARNLAWVLFNPAFENKVAFEGDCLVWVGPKGDATTVPFGFHKIAYEAVWGEVPQGINVCHHCDNRMCLNPNHFWLGTDFDNMQDRQLKQRTHNWKAESPHLSTRKLTPTEIKRRCRKRGLCVECHIPVIGGASRCPKHAAQDCARQKRYYAQKKLLQHSVTVQLGEQQ
jgi:ferredoxin